MLHPRLFVVALVLCVAWLAIVFELVRRRKLTEGLSFVWVAASLLLTVFVIFSSSFTRVARFFGIQLPENAVVVLGIATLAVASLYLCTRISDLNRKILRLSEEVAILKKRETKKLEERRT